MVTPMVNQYLGDAHRKFGSFARRWWLLLAALPWALGSPSHAVS